MAQTVPAALDDLKIVELPGFDPMPYFAAALAAKLLGDLGAEIIKIEPPGSGAAERFWGPFHGEERNPETNGLHLYLNTNKLAVTLDLAETRGRELLFGLLAQSDLLIDPNAAVLSQRLGIEWHTLHARFPRLIVVSTPFFAGDSPYRDLRGGDLIATQMSGVGYGTPLQQVTDPGTQPPLRLGGRQADYVTGYTAAAASLCAIATRRRNHGAGMHVDVNQWFAMAQMCRPELSIYTHESPSAPYRQRLLIRRKTSGQYIFPCKDGWVSCGLATNRHWRGMKRMMGNPDWAEGEMFTTFERRLANSDALEALLIDWFADRERAEIFALAQDAHVPSFPVNSPAEVANNPQYAARSFFVDSAHRLVGKVRMPGAPMIFSRTPWRLRTAAPLLGEHNAKILGERLGLTAGEIDEIARKVTTTIMPDGANRSSGSAGSRVARDDAGAGRTRLPFEGIRIADFGWIYALPYATAWLGALGADVIKIESTVRPDLVRFLSGTDGKMGPNRSGIFNAINFSKRSLSLNLAHPEARAIAKRIVRISDVVTENFTGRTMKKLGLAYDDLRALRPDLIMLSGTSLGQTGPFADTVGWGPTNQAFAGTAHLTGYPEGFPCAGGGTWPDFAVGVAMLFALTAALHYRDRTGEGQYIDVSMCEVVTSMLPEAMLEFFMNGRELGPIGNRDREMAPHGVFPVSGDDRWIALAIVNDAEFATLSQALGSPGLAHDPRYATVAARLSNVEALERDIAAITRYADRDELAARLRARNLAAAPVYDTKDLINDSAFRDGGILAEVEHKECGKRLTPVMPVRFGGLQPAYRAAPLAGEHTDEILTGLLGMSGDEIARLRSANAIV
jgi:crotonobetainyl-CoA:carnitine CoA-transferase CaiB-like acyl-CoA transferase